MLRTSKFTNRFVNHTNQLFAQFIIMGAAVDNRHKSNQPLTFYFMGNTYNCRFCDMSMFNKHTFQLCGTDAVPGNVYHIIHPTKNPDIAILITAGAISREVKLTVWISLGMVCMTAS